jgi:hypothetical protein
VSSSSSSSSTNADAGACGTILASDYDQSCVHDTDCVGVASGTICTGHCDCANDAINASAQATYFANFPNVQPLACPCAAPMQYCNAGKCEHGLRPVDAGDQ